MAGTAEPIQDAAFAAALRRRAVNVYAATALATLATTAALFLLP